MTDFIPAHKQPLDDKTREKLVAGATRHPLTFIERLAMPLLPAQPRRPTSTTTLSRCCVARMRTPPSYSSPPAAENAATAAERRAVLPTPRVS